MDLLLAAVLIRDPHLPDVVLRKLAGQSLEADERRDGTAAQRLCESIHHSLAAPVARLPISLHMCAARQST